MSASQSYYQILGVAPNSTSKQIRSAFRHKAKKIHPDIQNTTVFNADDRQMHLLIKAYHTLSDSRLRREYDLMHGTQVSNCSVFNFRDFLRRRTGDYKSLARLIFHDLLHDRYKDAISIYERYFNNELEQSVGRRSMRKHLSFYFSYNDYMDFLFLMAEAYERKSAYPKALCFYRNIALLESDKVAFGHFFFEVKKAIRRIVMLWDKSRSAQHIRLFLPTLLDIQALKDQRHFFEKKLARYGCVPQSRAGVPSARAGVPSARAGVPSARAGVPSARAGVPSDGVLRVKTVRQQRAMAASQYEVLNA